MRLHYFCLFLILSLNIYSQEMVCSDEDRVSFAAKIQEIEAMGDADMGNTLVAVGKTFKGSPYVAQTLELEGAEALVINLQAFDCTTYVENVLAFSLMLKKEETEFNAFSRLLQNIRYRDGELKGYSSRLHYFTDWIDNNEMKGLVRDISQEIGGVALDKEIDFMSTHRELYPMLKDDNSFDDIKRTEEKLSKKTLYYLPREKVAASEELIHNGDIIALTTSIDGLDVTHTGLAYREKGGRLHLLHASSSGEVKISEKPLADYLMGVSKNTGIIVARPQ